MKLFTKLALVSAIAISGNAMAMESLDDAALSAATGQDGISLTISTDEIKIDKLLIHDNDGLAATATTNGGLALGGTGTAGAIVVNDVSVKVSATAANAAFGGALALVKIDTDGGTGNGANGDAVLNINAKTNGIDVGVGSIAVAKSNTAINGARRGAGAENVIISGLNLTIGASELNIQLGNQPQGAMIVANGTIQGGIKINNLNLKDSSAGGVIGISDLRITSANSANLNVDTKISVLPSTVSGGGLLIKSAGANDIYINSIALGNTSSIGSVEIQGLEMVNSSILVSGH